MIVLLTDYGIAGPYVGQLHAVIHQVSHDIGIVDLCHTLPAFSVRSAAYLLPAYTHGLPQNTIIICVVDPGVGSDRPHALLKADGRYYIGPDNGLFDVLAARATSIEKYHFDWPAPASQTFHGRDVYVPAALKLLEAGSIDGLDCRLSQSAVLKLPADIDEVIYIDEFGNCVTGRFDPLERQVNHVVAGDHELFYARTFSDVPEGQCFWYENANGLLEIAANQASAVGRLGLRLGDPVTLKY